MTTMLSFRHGVTAVLVCLCLAAALPVSAQPPSGDPSLPPAAQSPPPDVGAAPQQIDEFVPISELPPEEQLPAAPMLVAAYVFVVLALFAYLRSVSRRLGAVKEDIARLEAETRRTGQR
jgi:hypothetical protein